MDPATGAVIWTMHVPLAEQLAFYSAHPPSCLDGLTCTPVQTDFAFDGHGEPVNAVFELACACGSTKFVVLAHVYDYDDHDDDNVAPPIQLECRGCAVTRVIFDSRKHGWDGALGNGGTWGVDDHVEELGDVDPPYPVIVRFELGSEVLGDDEWKGREPDLFTWVTILTRAETGELLQLFDHECA